MTIFFSWQQKANTIIKCCLAGSFVTQIKSLKKKALSVLVWLVTGNWANEHILIGRVHCRGTQKFI